MGVGVLKKITLLLIVMTLLFLVGCNPRIFFNDKKAVAPVKTEYHVNNPTSTFATDFDIHTYKQTEKSEKASNKIELLFMGDVMMDSVMADYIQQYGVDYPWTDVSNITKRADLAIVNLETSVSDRGTTKKPKGFGFRSAPYTLQGLSDSGIDLVSLANNHVKDFGNQAFYDTLVNLDAYHIQYVGAGKNLKDAQHVRIIEKNGIKLGFLSYTSILPYKDWQATDQTPGVAPLIINQYDDLLKNIRETKKSVDLLIVILHWGSEYHNTPNDWQINLAHKIIDNGADIIVGHHPHVLQGIELYKKKPILYSIGNFIFLKKNDNAGKTGIFRLVVNQKGLVEGSIYPVHILYTKANLLSSKSKLGKEIIDDLKSRSEMFHTIFNEDGSLSLH